MENIANEKIVETQEESEKDDEIVFKLLIGGKTISWAKTTLYSNLEDIHTSCLEKRKGHGRKLINYIEKNAKDHCSTSIRTCEFDPCNDEGINFFKSMCYEINPLMYGSNPSVKAMKMLK